MIVCLAFACDLFTVDHSFPKTIFRSDGILRGDRASQEGSRSGLLGAGSHRHLVSMPLEPTRRAHMIPDTRYPASGEDAQAIAASLTGARREPYQVVVKGLSQSKARWTPARWRSFGAENRSNQPSTPMRPPIILHALPEMCILLLMQHSMKRNGS